MLTLQNRLLPLTLTTLCLCAAANAQREEANLGFNYGPADFGGVVRVTSFAERVGQGNNFRRSVGSDLSSDVRVFGSTREACGASFIATATQTVVDAGSISFLSRSATGSAVVRVAGQTVFSSSAAGLQNVSTVIAPMNVFPGNGVSRAVSVGPFSVIVRANVSAQFNLGLDYAVTLATMSANMTGSMRGRANGSAIVSVAAAGVSAGVNSTLNLADVSTALDLTADASGLDGTMRFFVQPIRIAMTVFASSFGFTFTQNLFDVSLPARSGSLPLQ